MAFSEEQEKQILDTMGQFKDFINSQNKEKETKEKDDKEEDTNKLLSEAKKNVEKQNNQAEVQADLEKALSFNMNISNFAEKYKEVLPASVKSVIDVANSKQYASAIAKADEMRKAMIEAFLEIQANIEALPEGMKAKANAFKALTEDAKREKSGSYWEIVEVGAELQSAKKRAEAVNKANKDGNGNGGEDSAFRAKFLALGDKYKRKE